MSLTVSRHIPVRPDWLATCRDDPLDPDLPIVDPHHHLWDRPDSRYLADDLRADIDGSGHRILATVYVECHAMYREGGDPLERPLGEVAFAAGVGELAEAEGGNTALCRGVVGTLDLSAGDRVRPLLEAAVAVGQGRLRGLRCSSVHHPDPTAHGSMLNVPPGLLGSAAFRAGFAHLAPLGLSFDAWMYHTQLADAAELADAFTDTPIILNHVGGPIGIGPYAGRRDAVFADWRAALREVARRPNVAVKLGGLGMRLFGFDLHAGERAPGSEAVAAAWRPYVETAIEAFGPDRAMFESNFPVDKGSCGYGVLWNAFKRIAAGCSAAEKRALFADTAARVYRLGISV
ncbi:amidohydrolase family protein [Thalassobaculum sp.]|uniref:amidohydrolase family protein n=1 Tax=Thalassobaculum sp. TaxID=2022740 RepID=UPI0032EB21BD